MRNFVGTLPAAIHAFPRTSSQLRLEQPRPMTRSLDNRILLSPPATHAPWHDATPPTGHLRSVVAALSDADVQRRCLVARPHQMRVLSFMKLQIGSVGPLNCA